MKAAIFTNLIVSFEELYKKENDVSKKEKIVKNMEGVIEYANNRMINFGNVDTKSLGQKVKNSRTQLEKDNTIEEGKLREEEKDLINILKEYNINEFYEEKGEDDFDRPIFKIKSGIKLNDILRELSFEEKKEKFFKAFPILYEEFEANEIATIINGTNKLTEIKIKIGNETMTLENIGEPYYGFEEANGKVGLIIKVENISDVLTGIQTEVPFYITKANEKV